jgi:HAD superfamily hydrolase (TIGR01509 family)
VGRHPLDAPRAFVFDLDGLLISTEEACFQTARTLVRRHSSGAGELGRADYAPLVGRPVAESWAGLRERFRLAPALAQLVAERDETLLGWYGAPEVLPGAEALVCRLHADGLPLAIASGAPGPLVAAAAAALPFGACFSAVVSADHDGVRAPKPCPDAYLVACRLLGVDPAHATAIEDSPAGAAAALGAGLATLVVANEFTAGREFPDGVVHAPSLGAILDGLAEGQAA